MRANNILWVLFLLLLGAIPLFIYVWEFGAWMHFGNTEDFAKFGSYIGGSVGFSTFALLIWYNVKQVHILATQQKQTETLFKIEVAYKTFNIASEDLHTLLNQPFKYFCHNDIEWLGGQIKHEHSLHDLIQDHMLFQKSVIIQKYNVNFESIKSRPFFDHIVQVAEKIQDTKDLLDLFQKESQQNIIFNYHNKKLKHIVMMLEGYGFISSTQNRSLIQEFC